MTKRKLSIIITFLCILFVSIYFTTAYFTDSQTVENTLTGIKKDGLTAVLSESNWDASKGMSIMPNSTILKNPQITNTSNSELTELAAMKIEFVYSQDCPTVDLRGKVLNTSDMKIISDIVEIDFNLTTTNENGRWTRFTGETNKNVIQQFYYNGLIPKTTHMSYNVIKNDITLKGETTKPLFTTVHINEWANQTQIKQLEKIGGFEIKITGHILQQIQKAGSGLETGKSAYDSEYFTFN